MSDRTIFSSIILQNNLCDGLDDGYWRWLKEQLLSYSGLTVYEEKLDQLQISFDKLKTNRDLFSQKIEDFERRLRQMCITGFKAWLVFLTTKGYTDCYETQKENPVLSSWVMALDLKEPQVEVIAPKRAAPAAGTGMDALVQALEELKRKLKLLAGQLRA